MADRASAGFCYDIATLLPLYNPLAVPVPTYIDPNTTSVAATSLSTVLVFGEPFGAAPLLLAACKTGRQACLVLLCACFPHRLHCLWPPPCVSACSTAVAAHSDSVSRHGQLRKLLAVPNSTQLSLLGIFASSSSRL